MTWLEKCWNPSINIDVVEKSSYKEFEAKLEGIHQRISNVVEDGFTVQKFNYLGNVAQSHDEELKSLIDQNKQLRQTIDEKLSELSERKTEYENYKKKQKALSQEIKERHEAFLMTKKYYKKYLKMYFTIESKKSETQTIFVQFFTEAKKESDNYSVRLLRDPKAGSYQLLNTTPKLASFTSMQRNLQETNDITGTLCFIRQAFYNMKMKKK